MAYFTFDDLAALIPVDMLTDGLDDAGTGESAAFAKVQKLAEARINGLLATRYSVPIPAGDVGADAFLLDAGVHIAAAIVYGRRGVPPEQWPFKGEHSNLMARLRAIAAGEQQLSTAVDVVDEGAVFIGTTADTYSPQLSA